ncbi:hypothetical protein [Nocardioides sp.]|uniref:hypothetical protein n=1 Tax=Nocardioides sp. TaxID=35761 RepID=UPI0035115F5F
MPEIDRGTTRLKPTRTGAAVAVVVVAAAVGLGAVAGSSARETARSAAPVASCAGVLVWQGREYLPVAWGEAPGSMAVRLGDAERPACDDGGGAVPAARVGVWAGGADRLVDRDGLVYAPTR